MDTHETDTPITLPISVTVEITEALVDQHLAEAELQPTPEERAEILEYVVAEIVEWVTGNLAEDAIGWAIEYYLEDKYGVKEVPDGGDEYNSNTGATD